jgi:hypothetical protein
LDTISPLRKIKIIPFNNLGHNTIVPAPGDYDVGEFGGMKIGR